jgi:hypothetical protein
LRIAGEVNCDATAKRCHDAAEENVGIRVNDAVGKPGCLAEGSQSAVHKNKKLRWSNRAHRIWRERAGFRWSSYTIELQSNGLRKLRSGSGAASRGRCAGNIARFSGRGLWIKSRRRILRPVLPAGNLELALYESVLSRSLCRLCRHDVSGILVDPFLSNRRRAERCRCSIIRWLTKADDAQKHRTRDKRRKDNKSGFQHIIQAGAGY